jgi:hypothetical protein
MPSCSSFSGFGPSLPVVLAPTMRAKCSICPGENGGSAYSRSWVRGTIDDCVEQAVSNAIQDRTSGSDLLTNCLTGGIVGGPGKKAVDKLGKVVRPIFDRYLKKGSS